MQTLCAGSHHIPHTHLAPPPPRRWPSAPPPALMLAARALAKVAAGPLAPRLWGPGRRPWPRSLGSSTVVRDLREFLDLQTFKEGEERVVGSEWKASQLRLKSWEDLHKLWFVLLKERNMLRSEQLAARAASRPMASPRRISKVRRSMNRIKQVLSERARAVGEPAERRRMLDMINAV
ncbi:unnamed protein product [Ostreobium quekettii]|uniref:Large ribosomal subunit protein uL29m n=1 Tax=Ostreobium quekettii TaxID=121088 RepID=A0A8S1IMT4_9CHLO|nr:unnamed protein product [Ostreobium quekettii]